ncbi:hypothetical protein NUSPORA_01791 [Nucleospora cyclopteri]
MLLLNKLILLFFSNCPLLILMLFNNTNSINECYLYGEILKVINNNSCKVLFRNKYEITVIHEPCDGIVKKRFLRIYGHFYKEVLYSKYIEVMGEINIPEIFKNEV